MTTTTQTCPPRVYSYTRHNLVNKYTDTASLNLLQLPHLVRSTPTTPQLNRRAGRRIPVIGKVDTEPEVVRRGDSTPRKKSSMQRQHEASEPTHLTPPSTPDSSSTRHAYEEPPATTFCPSFRSPAGERYLPLPLDLRLNVLSPPAFSKSHYILIVARRRGHPYRHTHLLIGSIVEPIANDCQHPPSSTQTGGEGRRHTGRFVGSRDVHASTPLGVGDRVRVVCLNKGHG